MTVPESHLTTQQSGRNAHLAELLSLTRVGSELQRRYAMRIQIFFFSCYFCYFITDNGLHLFFIYNGTNSFVSDETTRISEKKDNSRFQSMRRNGMN